MKALKRASVVMLESNVDGRWQHETSTILEVLRSHHPNERDYHEVAPPSERTQLAIREDLSDRCAGLTDLVSAIRERLLDSCAVFVPKLGLNAFDTGTRAMLSYAIGACLGNPTATDKQQVIWDVKARKVDAPGFITFSETDLEATFHSDSAFSAAPEPTFLLYCMEAARCGGGMSRVCDARALRRDIDRTQPWITDVLANRELPFRVPSAFLKSGDRNAVQATLAPVFADSPLIRYRRDTLLEGLEHFPQYDDPDARRALDAFDRLLNASPHVADFFMPRDSLVVMDNHRALHARTAFRDQARHLLRIRLAWDNAPAYTSGYQTVARVHEAVAS